MLYFLRLRIPPNSFRSLISFNCKISMILISTYQNHTVWSGDFKNQVLVASCRLYLKGDESMNTPKKRPKLIHLPTDQFSPKPEMELPPHNFATCLACITMKELQIEKFNNIPSNCRSPQQEDSWCSLLHLVFTISYR